MQAKRRRISMANMSTQPRPEERSLRRSVSKDASASASGAANESFPSTCSGPAFETPCFRAAPQNEGVRRIASAICAWSVAHASAVRLERRGAGLRREPHRGANPLPFLSPEAPPSFGDLADASPLVAVFTPRTRAEVRPLDLTTFAEPKFALAPGADSALARGALRRHSRVRLNKGQPLRTSRRRSSTIPPSGLRSRRYKARSRRRWERLVARDDATRNPLGAGDWRAARGAIAAFYAKRAYTPMWVGENRPDRALGGRRSTQLERARDDGLNLSAFALPRDLAVRP